MSRPQFKGLTNMAGNGELADHFRGQMLCGAKGRERHEVEARTGNYCISTAACKELGTRMAGMYAARYVLYDPPYGRHPGHNLARASLSAHPSLVAAHWKHGLPRSRRGTRRTPPIRTR